VICVHRHTLECRLIEVGMDYGSQRETFENKNGSVENPKKGERCQ
jgi:hypothetical protein